MLFEFALTPLEEIRPWGKSGQQSLHWFGLTDGRFWIEAGEATLLEYRNAARRHGGSRYCEYQVARLYEDIIEAAPFVLEPLPDDLQRPEAAVARAWIIGRQLSTSYLSPSAHIVMWSDETMVHIEWDNRDRLLEGAPAWSADHGSYSLPRAAFIEEVRTFHRRLMEAMSDRVGHVAAGALSAEIRIDLPGLLREHESRSHLSAANFGPLPVPTDWHEARQAL